MGRDQDLVPSLALGDTMNLFNRILVSLFALIIWVIGSLIVLLVTGVIQPDSGFLKTLLSLYQFWRFIARLRGTDANTAFLMGFGMALVGFLLFVLEGFTLWRSLVHHETTSYVVQQDSEGKLTVSHDMICQVVQHEAEMVPGVQQARPKVKGGPEGLRIATGTLLDLDADAPAVSQAVQTRIHEAVTRRIGLPVAEVQIAVLPAQPSKGPPRRVA
jgi:uncharacterized alkaline shock family protein YloU